LVLKKEQSLKNDCMYIYTHKKQYVPKFYSSWLKIVKKSNNSKNVQNIKVIVTQTCLFLCEQ